MTKKRAVQRAACTSALAFACASSFADTINWTNSAGGTFNTLGNWNSGAGPVPGSGDTAQFNLANTYTTTFDTSPTNAAFNINAGNVTWATTSGKTYSLSGAASITGGSSLKVSAAPGFSGLNISAASFDIAGSFTMETRNKFSTTGDLNQSSGSLTIAAGNAFGTALSIGGSANLAGSTTVSGGSTISITGAMSLSGSMSLASSSDFVNVGGNVALSNTATLGGSGSVTQTGATTTTVSNNAAITVLSYTTGSGLFAINSGASVAPPSVGGLNINGDILLNGGSLLVASGSVFNWVGGRTMTIQAGGQFRRSGITGTPANSIVNMSSGSILVTPTMTGNCTFTVSTGGQLNVTGGTVTLQASGSGIALLRFQGAGVFDGPSVGLSMTGSSSRTGSVESGGSLTLRNAANINFVNSLSVSGTANVQSNATLTASNITLNSGGALNVTGGTVSQPGAGALTVTPAAGNTATVTIGAGGVYNTGTTITTIGDRGALDITGGTYVANNHVKIESLGSISVTGGKLNLKKNKLIAVNGVFNGALGSWNGSSYTGITGMIASGRGDGSWNGNGLVTTESAATTSVLTTLAIAPASATPHAGGTFGGISVLGGDALVMYTWGGDADLSGELNGDDYFALDSHVLQSGSVFGFHNGDFDYNGELNGDDYFIIDSNILQAQSNPPFPTGSGAGLSIVPEPGALGATLALATRGSLRRRARTRTSGGE